MLSHHYFFHRIQQRAIMVAMLLCSFIFTQAYTVEWALPPIYYPRISRVAPGVFQVAKSPKSHIVDIQANKPIYTGENAYVTAERILGYGITIIGTAVNEYDRELAGFLFEDDLRFVPCQIKGLFPGSGTKRWGYPTENTLMVRDANGLLGYIGLDGHMVIKCQFEKGRPFRDGFALVQTCEGKWMYIGKDYDVTHQPLKVSVGDFSEGMQFSDGKTWVNTKKGWVKIDKNGKKVKTNHIVKDNRVSEHSYYSEDCIRVNIKQEVPEKYSKDIFSNDDIIKYQTGDSLIGYSRLGKVIVPAQFSATLTEDFDCGYAAVTSAYEDYMGILKLIPGDFVPISADTISAVTNNSATPVEVQFSYPKGLDTSKLQVMVDLSHLDNLIEIQNAEFKDGVCKFSFQPIAGKGECEMTYQVYSEYNLLLFEETKPLTFVSTTQASIGKVYSDATTSSGNQTFWSTVHVPPYIKSLEANFELLIDGNLYASKTTSLNANETKRVELTVPVERSCNATARITLSDGQKKEYKVQLRKFGQKPIVRKEKTQTPDTHKRKRQESKPTDSTRGKFVPY